MAADPDADATVFTEAPDFAAALSRHTTVRLVVDPDDPLRGRTSHDGRVTALDTAGDTCTVTVTVDELVEGSFPDEYDRVEVEYRCPLPTETPPSDPITVERNVAGEYAEPEWVEAGTLVAGGVMQMFGANKSND